MRGRGGRSLIMLLKSLLVAVLALAVSLDYDAARASASTAAADGKLKSARTTLKQAISELRRSLTGPNQTAADLLGDLGGIYKRLDQQAEAIAALEEAADVLMALHGRGDPRYAMALDKLADAHMQAGSFEDARKMYVNILDAMRAHLGTSHPGYEMTLGKAATAALQAGKPKGAAKAYGELLRLSEGHGEPPESQKDQSVAGLAQVRVQYARALAAIGNFAEALVQANLAQESYANSSSLAGSFEHAASFNGVAGVLEQLNRDEEAVAAMAKALQLAQALGDPEMAGGAQRNLDGLKAHVARKQQRRQQKAMDGGETAKAELRR